MQTGEGKTIVTGLPAFPHALTGRSAHMATTNTFLTERDHAETQAPFKLLGLPVGLVISSMPPDQKRPAHSCDITYGTGYDFRVNFLRDQLLSRSRQPDVDHSRGRDDR